MERTKCLHRRRLRAALHTSEMGYKQGVLKKQTSSSCNNIKNVEGNEKNEIKNPHLKMVRKCCATDCKSYHLSEKEKVSVY